MRASELVAYAAFAVSVSLTLMISAERDELLASLASPRSTALPQGPQESQGGMRGGSVSRQRIEAPDSMQRRESELAALGYAAHARVGPGDRRKSGVVLRDDARMSPGLNVVFPEFGCERIEFLDAGGRTVREIDVSALPKDECYSLKPVGDGYVFLARPNLFRLDRTGSIVWRIDEGFTFHHDFDASPDRIVALDHRTRRNAKKDTGGEFVDDRLVVIGAQGEVWSILSLHDLFWDELKRRARESSVDPFSSEAVEVLGMDGPGDFYHANSIQILTADGPIGRRGDVLLSLRTLDTLVVLDPETGEIRWQWGRGILDHPHHPTLLPNGRVLVFDNGWHRGWSRVVEIEPATGKIVWEYRAMPPETFFTQRRGAAYRLANGNTLITESDRGRAFEVMPDGTKVWEYWVPPSRHADETLRATLFRVARVEEGASR